MKRNEFFHYRDLIFQHIKVFQTCLLTQKSIFQLPLANLAGSVAGEEFRTCFINQRTKSVCFLPAAPVLIIIEDSRAMMVFRFQFHNREMNEGRVQTKSPIPGELMAVLYRISVEKLR